MIASNLLLSLFFTFNSAFILWKKVKKPQTKSMTRFCWIILNQTKQEEEEEKEEEEEERRVLQNKTNLMFASTWNSFLFWENFCHKSEDWWWLSSKSNSKKRLSASIFISISLTHSLARSLHSASFGTVSQSQI